MIYFKRHKHLLTGLLTIVFCCSVASSGLAADVLAAPELVIQQNFQDSQPINASFADTGRHILLLHETVSWYGLANGQLVYDTDKTDIFTNVNQNGHLLYPVRSISQYLGFSVDWDGEQRSVGLSNPSGHQVIFTLDSSEALVDGEIQSLPIAPAIIDDKVMLPIRVLVEALGGSISYEHGLLVLSDRQDPFTEAEAASLANMKLAYLQYLQSRITTGEPIIPLAQIGGYAYWRQGLNQLYAEANGTRQFIDLGSSVQFILGIYKDRVYYVTGEENPDSGRLLHGQICRADLTGGQRQVLLDDYYGGGYYMPITKGLAVSHTYFLHGGGHDYIIIPGSALYDFYRLDDDQVVIIQPETPEQSTLSGLDGGFSDPLVFGDDLYHFSHSMGISPGLYHILLRSDGTAAVQDKLFPELAFYKIIALDDHQLLALAEPYHQELKEHGGRDIYQVDLHALTVSQLTNEHIPYFSNEHNMLVLTNDGHVLYFNEDHELCQISPLTQ